MNILAAEQLAPIKLHIPICLTLSGAEQLVTEELRGISQVELTPLAAVLSRIRMARPLRDKNIQFSCVQHCRIRLFQSLQTCQLHCRDHFVFQNCKQPL